MTTMELIRNVWWSKTPELTGHDKTRNGVEPKGIEARPTDMIRAGKEKTSQVRRT